MLEQLARYSRIFGFVLYCTGMAFFCCFALSATLSLLSSSARNVICCGLFRTHLLVCLRCFRRTSSRFRRYVATAVDQSNHDIRWITYATAVNVQERELI